MGLLADAFELVGTVPPSTALFVPTRQIKRDEIPASLRDDLSDATKLEFFDRACKPFAGEEKSVLDCAKAMLLLDLGRRSEAAETLNAVQPKLSKRAASAVAEIRSWLLRSDPDPAVALQAWERWHKATGACWPTRWLTMVETLGMAISGWDDRTTEGSPADRGTQKAPRSEATAPKPLIAQVRPSP